MEDDVLVIRFVRPLSKTFVLALRHLASLSAHSGHPPLSDFHLVPYTLLALKTRARVINLPWAHGAYVVGDVSSGLFCKLFGAVDPLEW